MEITANKLLQGIDTIIIRVTNIEASRDWYLAKLGLVVIFEDENLKLIVFNTNGPTSLTVWQSSHGPSINWRTDCYPIFRTPDIDALHHELLSRGVEAGEISQDENGKYFPFYDLDGNMMEACQVREQTSG